MWHGEVFHGLGVRDVKSLILVGVLFPLDGEGEEKERKKKRRKKSLWGRRVSPELDQPCWLCSRLQLIDAIKG
jgi:hypothetical protein